jgi:hypothetical protein
MRRVVTEHFVGELCTRWTRRGAGKVAAEANGEHTGPVEYKVKRLAPWRWAVMGYQAKLLGE